MTKVVNKYYEDFDVYIGRGSIFGNPYTSKPLDETKASYSVSTKEEAIEKFEYYFLNKMNDEPEFLREVLKLKDKTLGCFCRPKDGFKGKLLCHGQVIAGFLDDIDYKLVK